MKQDEMNISSHIQSWKHL